MCLHFKRDAVLLRLGAAHPPPKQAVEVLAESFPVARLLAAVAALPMPAVGSNHSQQGGTHAAVAPTHLKQTSSAGLAAGTVGEGTAGADTAVVGTDGAGTAVAGIDGAGTAGECTAVAGTVRAGIWPPGAVGPDQGAAAGPHQHRFRLETVVPGRRTLWGRSPRRHSLAQVRSGPIRAALGS